jgi:hypothetical protein
MKDLFRWSLPLNQSEIKKVWKDGILTVDTNVLLDLYRYHFNTRQALLASLNKFKGRAWISYQVADEFFKNRSGVIVSSKGAFSEAEKLIFELNKAIEEPLRKLKSSRIIPDELEERLESGIKVAVDEAKASIEKIRNEYPDYKKQDPILQSISGLFESKIGLPFEKEKLAEVIKEAKYRKDNKIPPGFKDAGKDGEKPYGDYIMWRQILDYVKETQKPLIFVTSEQKEDWWEKAQGETIGPLYELLKEFNKETGQRFLLYSTYRFLEFSDKSSGKEANFDALEEIRHVVKQREKPLIKILDQNAKISDTELASGTVRIKLLEPAYTFTCSGRFVPKLKNVPTLAVQLIGYPAETPKNIIRIGTGTTFDFNIHLKSNEPKRMLPMGEYVFEYTEI